ncbi:TetR/AcrR family transcriptional regulator [Actinospica durhamensis]|uniref:TetR/AcrR family transcriptional regulator n=1 Tax=Actinospica durhamensis TaxID=1508375 RepID=A0A941ITM3_9ACTN|nr:TetR/AcrR family transcriptional regulator [Actinospica durhamensis]MBR7837792.1 TetR/AcrR family transcriptional regulator [Actinospica durhamensis]
MTRPRPEAPDRPARGRRRASHSLDAVLNATVELLDEAGEPALTLRALATRLGTGVGSIYWYVSGKDELIDRAIEHVLGGVLNEVEGQTGTGDPIDDLRVMAVTLFDAIADRPWLGARFMRNIDVQGNSLRLYEKLGQVALRLELTPLQRFHAVSAVVGVVASNGADMGQEPPQAVVDGSVTREEFFGHHAAAWRALDPEEYPFVHDIVDEFEGHDDREQFLAALELTLAGLRLEAGI